MKEKQFLPLVAERLGIQELNPMQRRTMEAVAENRDILLLSPTGSGKTLAFLLPLLKLMRPSTTRVQAVIIAPARELVLQIYGVLRPIAAGLQVTALYGGHKMVDEINSLKGGADIIVATPGRLLDHVNQRHVDLLPTRIAVLDEFDKSLELGFEDEMQKIFARLKNVSRTILTSATDMATLPDFVKLNNPLRLDYLQENKQLRSRLRVHKVEASGKDKLESLLVLLRNLASPQGQLHKTIIFVNHRESAERIATFLSKEGVDAALYHGALDQIGREKAVAMFNNGSCPILVATDLAARGLDISDVHHILHYHQPLAADIYTHRNGRTARMDAEGDIYVILGPEENLAPFIELDDEYFLDTTASAPLTSPTTTIFISAGRKEKVSRGDILGFLTKEANIPAAEIGKIDIFDHYSLLALSRSALPLLQSQGNSLRIKGQRRKISKA